MIDPNYSITSLVIAVIQHSILEARKGNADARRWLYADGVLWAEAITDIHPEKIRAAFDRKLGRHKPRKSRQEAPGSAESISP